MNHIQFVNGEWVINKAMYQPTVDGINARIKSCHDSRGCSNWETWTDRDVLFMDGGHGDVTYDGCRKCRVAIAR